MNWCSVVQPVAAVDEDAYGFSHVFLDEEFKEKRWIGRLHSRISYSGTIGERENRVGTLSLKQMDAGSKQSS